jgi:hypothetical protein
MDQDTHSETHPRMQCPALASCEEIAVVQAFRPAVSLRT